MSFKNFFGRKQKGFTILELLVVISIFSLLVSLTALHTGRSVVTFFRLHLASRQLYFDFLAARQQAIRGQDEYGIRFDLAEGSYTFFSGKKGDLKKNYLSNNLAFKEISFTGNRPEASFKPTGTARGGSVVIASNTGNSYRIVVYGVTGRIRYERGS